jgi:anti-sigma-K factor RskA
LAATALLAAGITGVAILIPARREVTLTRAALRAAEDAAQSSRARAASAEQKFRALGAPATRVFAMGPAGPQPEAAARIFWDESRGTWQVFFSKMKTPAPGRTYQLWFITPGQAKVSAGTFAVDSAGEATLDVAIPKDLGEIALAAVTEEPEGGVPQPTGAIQLVGKLGT